MSEMFHQRTYTPPNSYRRGYAPAGQLIYNSPVFEQRRLNISGSSNSSICKSNISSAYLGNLSPEPYVKSAYYADSIGSPISCSLDMSSLQHSMDGIARYGKTSPNDSMDGSQISEIRRYPTKGHSYSPVENDGSLNAGCEEIVKDPKLFDDLAKDKAGARHLQEIFPQENTLARRQLMGILFSECGRFKRLSSDVFGNFFIQFVIDHATESEKSSIHNLLMNNMYELCLNRYSCRVVQKAIDKNLDINGKLLEELRDTDLARLAQDQNANHVLQKILKSFPYNKWSFVIEYFVEDPVKLFEVAENKYGCRVVQLSLECLSAAAPHDRTARNLLSGIMRHLVDSCVRLSSNEFANYVIQHVITEFADIRAEIIEKCLLRNLLSMAQEKYASHVVEKALEHAPPKFLREMIEEIFDGYIPDPETKKDALDIMLFHQYGNYVVQRMLKICLEAGEKHMKGTLEEESHIRLIWLKRLRERIEGNRTRLHKYSSGKKILDMLKSYPMAGNTTSTYDVSQDGSPRHTNIPRIPHDFR